MSSYIAVFEADGDGAGNCGSTNINELRNYNVFGSGCLEMERVTGLNE